MTWRRTVLRRNVVVNLLSGTAISGVLMQKSGPLLVLKNAVLHEPGSPPQPMDGEAIVERTSVDYIQALPRG